nr:hypothetical protein [Pseudoclavibacter sp. RFBI4]
MLRRDVGGDAGRPVEARLRGRIDDAAAAALGHDLEDMLHAEEDAAHVDGEDLLVVVDARFRERADGAFDARVVEEHVDRPERLDGLGDVALDVGLVGDIRGDRDDLAVRREAFARGLEGLREEVDQGHACAQLEELLSCRRADAARAAGDDH